MGDCRKTIKVPAIGWSAYGGKRLKVKREISEKGKAMPIGRQVKRVNYYAYYLGTAVFLTLCFALVAKAATPVPGAGSTPASSVDSDTGQLITYFRGWYYNLILPAGSILAGAMIAWGGIMYAQSGGDPEKVKQGKEYIFGAISGLALLITAALIVRTLTGTN
jgi:hypothetical protein